MITKTDILREKNKLKEEIIKRIENGYLDNGLYKLLEAAGDLSPLERKSIAVYWFRNKKNNLINYYLYDLLTDNRDSIKRTDYFYLKEQSSIKMR